MPAESEPPARGSDAGSDAGSGRDDKVCYICFDESANAHDHLYTDVCACKTTAIHRSCIEKLVNSKARRQLELPERMACPTCAQRFVVPLVATRIVRPPSPYRFAENVTRAAFVVGFFLMIIVIGRRSPIPAPSRLSILAVGGALALVSTLAALVFVCLERRRSAKLPRDPSALDDEQFHNAFVRSHRTEASVLQLPAHDLSQAMLTKARADVCLLVDAGVSYTDEEIEVLFTPVEEPATDGIAIVVVDGAHAADGAPVEPAPAGAASTDGDAPARSEGGDDRRDSGATAAAAVASGASRVPRHDPPALSPV